MNVLPQRSACPTIKDLDKALRRQYNNTIHAKAMKERVSCGPPYREPLEAERGQEGKQENMAPEPRIEA